MSPSMSCFYRIDHRRCGARADQAIMQTNAYGREVRIPLCEDHVWPWLKLNRLTLNQVLGITK